MIHVSIVPITAQQALALRKWLQSEEAELYRHVLVSNIARLQAKVGQNLIESDDQGNHQDKDAADAVHEVLPYVHALSVLEDFRGSDANLVSVSLSLDPPVKIQETS